MFATTTSRTTCGRRSTTPRGVPRRAARVSPWPQLKTGSSRAQSHEQSARSRSRAHSTLSSFSRRPPPVTGASPRKAGPSAPVPVCGPGARRARHGQPERPDDHPALRARRRRRRPPNGYRQNAHPVLVVAGVPSRSTRCDQRSRNARGPSNRPNLDDRQPVYRCRVELGQLAGRGGLTCSTTT